jgi:Flp pilus assembly protein TadG
MIAPGSGLSGCMGALCRFHADRAGGVAAAFAIALTVMIGFGGAATEIGTWLLTRRAMQGAADAAAVSAVNATAHGGPDITTQAKGVAAQNGWTHGSNGVTVTVNQPPSVGNFTGNAQAVEVIIAQAQPLFFSALLPSVTAPTIKARGVAAPNPVVGNGCLLALGTGNSLQLSGNGRLTLTGCDADGNGNISLNGNAVLGAHNFDIGGTTSLSGNAAINLTNGPGTKNDPVPFTDPYAGQRSFTKPATCATYGGATTIAPGAFCGLNISGGNVTMQSGIYYIEGGTFSVSGNATLTSQSPGVTIVLTSTVAAPSSFATVNISGNANLNLTALATGTTRGLVFFQDPAQPAGATENLSGNGNISLTGAVYFPNETIDLSGNGSLSSATCLQIIGLRVTGSGNAGLAANCVGTGVSGIAHGAGATRLVE